MNIIINNSSMIPIYEQIVEEIKSNIVKGNLKENDVLPSVRSLSKELKISALTVKKAYDFLEELGLTKTIHGKGTYIVGLSESKLRDENIKEVEEAFLMAIEKAKRYKLSEDEINEIFNLMLGD